MMDTKRDPRRADSLEKALDILETITADPHGETLAEFKKRMRLDKSTIWRLLGTLARRGYVDYDPVLGRYSLGLTVATLGTKKLRSLRLLPTASPVIASLVRECQETVQLVLHMGGQVLYLMKEECSQSVQVRTEIGAMMPVHCTASGKIFLAWMEDEERQDLLSRLELTRFTEHTIVDLPHMARELEAIRRQGYAVDNEENELGVRCIASPIFGPRGQVLAAVSLAAPAFRLSDAALIPTAEQVRRRAEEISRNLGFVAQTPGRPHD